MSRNKLVPKLRFKGFEEGWRSIEIKDVADVVGGGTPSTEVDEYWNGDIDWYTPSEVGKTKFIKSSEKTITIKGLNNSSAKLLPKNTILLSSRATIGETSILTKDSATNQGFQSLIVNSDNDVEFIYYLIGTIKKELFRKASGSTFLEINSKEIKKLNIKVPKTDEQEKIASFLSVVDKKLNLLNDKLVQIQYFKNFLLRNIFSQKIRFKEFDCEWEECYLKDLGDFYRGHSYNSSNVVDSGLLVLRSNNIKNNQLDLNEKGLQFVNKPCKPELNLIKGDIVICMSNGTKSLVGKSAKYEGNYMDKLTVGAFCSIFRSNSPLAEYIFQSNSFKKYMYILLAGTNINNLKNSDLEKMVIYVPKIDEQEKIASFLSVVDKKLNLLNDKLVQIQYFKNFLLRNIFSQKIRFKEFSTEWKEYKLNDLFEFFPTNSFSRDKLNYEEGEVQNIHYGDIHTIFPNILDYDNNIIPFINNNVDLSKIKEASYCVNGDLIIADASEDYADIGKATEIINIPENKKVVAGLHTILARNKNNSLVEGFKGYLFLNEDLRLKIKIIANGISVLGISKSNLGNLEVKIPSIKEQDKIASFLSVVDKKLNLLNDKLVQIQYFKNFLLRNIFSQKIRFKEFKKEWRSYKLGDIVELMRNGTSQTQLNFETSFPVTRIETISKGVINYNRVGYVEEIDEGYRLLNGDILLSNINSIKYIGNLVYFDDDKTLYHGMNLMLMRFKEDFNKKFLYYFMKYHQQWFQMMACQAVNQASINQTSLKKFPFLIPNDIKEQNKIVNILDLSSMKIDLIENQISLMEDFKKGLLQQMFI